MGDNILLRARGVTGRSLEVHQSTYVHGFGGGEPHLLWT